MPTIEDTIRQFGLTGAWSTSCAPDSKAPLQTVIGFGTPSLSWGQVDRQGNRSPGLTIVSAAIDGNGALNIVMHRAPYYVLNSFLKVGAGIRLNEAGTMLTPTSVVTKYYTKGGVDVGNNTPEPILTRCWE